MIDQAARDALFEKLSFGELTPAEAETEAARLGLAPLAPILDDDSFDPAGEAHWTLPMAVAWIAYRNPSAVRIRWETYRKECWTWHFREWGVGEGETHKGWFLEHRHPGKTTLAALTFADILKDETESDPRFSMTVTDAKTALWEALWSDCFRVTGIDQQSGERVEILPTTWLDLKYVEENGHDELRPEAAQSVGPRRYRDVLLPSRAIRGLWREPFVVEAIRLPPNVPPVGEGYMPLYCAAQWIATEGGVVSFEPETPEVWRMSYDALLAAMASEKVRVVGTRDGEREPVPGFHFADCEVDYPFGEPPMQLLMSEVLYLRSYPFMDDQHWRGGFDDALMNRRGIRWSRLMVTRGDVRRLWPFSAGEPAKSGAPGRPTSMHLIFDELDRRAVEGRIVIGIKEEAHALLEWIAVAHPANRRPTAKTIENQIRARYRELKKPPK